MKASSFVLTTTVLLCATALFAAPVTEDVDDWVLTNQGSLIESESAEPHLSRKELLGEQSGLQVSSGALLSTTTTSGISRSFIPDYPGCSMGWFWCGKFKDAGIPPEFAAKITVNPDIHQPGEWFYDGQPTCVATRGSFSATCDQFSSVLVCAGSTILTTDFGEAEEQVQALKEAILNNGTFVHPNCPGCSRGREIANSISTCFVSKGQHCEVDCEEGFVASGVRWCGQDGVVTGGDCSPPLIPPSVSPPPPEPSPAAPYVVTPVDFDHSNWTQYEQLRNLETAAYREILVGEACEHLLDLENYYHNIMHLNPSSVLRRGLFSAARAVDCAWIHDMQVADGPQRVHHNPIRGDHGPWKKSVPNVFRLRLPGQGVVAVSLGEPKNGVELLGSDLYRAVAQALSVKQDAYSVFLPKSNVPIDDSTKLSTLQLKSSDVLEGVLGRQRRHVTNDKTEGTKLAWRLGAVVDPDRAPIAP